MSLGAIVIDKAIQRCLSDMTHRIFFNIILTRTCPPSGRQSVVDFSPIGSVKISRGWFLETIVK